MFYLRNRMTWKNKSRPNKTARIAFAYVASEDDPLVLVPDPEMVEWAEKAFDHLEEGYSQRKVAAWLSEKAGRKISHQGLKNLWQEHRPDSKVLKRNARAFKKKQPKTKEEKELFTRIIYGALN